MNEKKLKNLVRKFVGAPVFTKRKINFNQPIFYKRKIS